MRAKLPQASPWLWRARAWSLRPAATRSSPASASSLRGAIASTAEGLVGIVAFWIRKPALLKILLSLNQQRVDSLLLAPLNYRLMNLFAKCQQALVIGLGGQFSIDEREAVAEFTGRELLAGILAHLIGDLAHAL